MGGFGMSGFDNSCMSGINGGIGSSNGCGGCAGSFGSLGVTVPPGGHKADGGGKGGCFAEQGKGCFGKDGKKSSKTLSEHARPDVQQVLGQFVGTIKSFNAKNGFGFIECEALMQQGRSRDVYLHHLQLGGFHANDTVIFTAYLNKKGQAQAMDLLPVNGLGTAA